MAPTFSRKSNSSLDAATLLAQRLSEILAAGERVTALGASRGGVREITELVNERPDLAAPAHAVFAAQGELLIEYVRQGNGGQVAAILARALNEIRAGARPPTNIYRPTPKPMLREGANYFPDRIVVVKDGKIVKTVQQGIF